MYSQVVYTVERDKYLCHLLQYDEPKERPQEIVVQEIPQNAILIKSSLGYEDFSDAKESISSNIKVFKDFDDNFSYRGERNYYSDMICRPTSVFYIHPDYTSVHDKTHTGWLVKRRMVSSYYAKMRAAIANNKTIDDIHEYLSVFIAKFYKQPVYYPNLEKSVKRWEEYLVSGYPLTVNGTTKFIPIDALKYYYIEPLA